MTSLELDHLARALPEVLVLPHFEALSYRVRGKIFVTVPPPGDVCHVFVSESDREQALRLYPQFLAPLHWGARVRGLRVLLDAAELEVVGALVRAAWRHKAP